MLMGEGDGMPRPDRSEERRDQILEAAIQAFSEKGLHEARMEDIATRAGLSKPALYLYFRNKDAIIGSLLRFFFAREMRGIRKLQDAPDSARSRIESMGEQFARSIEHMQVAMPLLLEFYGVAAREPAVRKFLTEAYQDIHDILKDLLEQGVAAGEFRPMDASNVAFTLIALYEGVVLVWVMAPQVNNVGRRLLDAQALVLAGL
jgi:AcrR family transcriptional regulator